MNFGLTLPLLLYIILLIKICQLLENLERIPLIYFRREAHMKNTTSIIALTMLVSACSPNASQEPVKEKQANELSGWQLDFLDEFDSFNTENWQDQMLWVNSEDRCYIPNNQFNTREVSESTLKLRVIDLGEERPYDNMSKEG